MGVAAGLTTALTTAATWAVVLVLSIPLLLITGVIVVVSLAILKGRRPAKGAAGEADEARMIQDIYHGLQRMEQRVEALETILLDRERKERS